ncbi:MAG: S1 RNA-binding domain-containing protein [Calditrichaceae bacterium]
MIKIGKYNDLRVERLVDFGLYLKKGEEEVLLPAKYVPENSKPGDKIQVFIYTDSEDRVIATTLTPKAALDEFAYLRVKDVNRFGAFLDWGLEKDLFVPFREQKIRMSQGESYIVRLCLDTKTNRLFATTKIQKYLKNKPDELKENQEVNLLFYRQTDLGMMAIIDNTYSGMLFSEEIREDVRVGDSRIGYIKNIRDDEKIDLSLKPLGYKAVIDSKPDVMDLLEKAGGFLPYNDKSSPREIEKTFRMSKKMFKKVIGGLYKDGKISIEEKGITIIK